MAEIKLLSERTINQIAAGEVVDRPISVIKELVENSLDAKATKIVVEIEEGGHNLISISDNGYGIEKDQIALAVERHATSKLDEKDINNIVHFGFRGEALPSIASVSKLKIISRVQGSNDAWELNINGGEKSSLKPASRDFGTTVEVRDIFSFTPARLKFLKSQKSEVSAALDLIHRFALVNDDVSFKLIANGKVVYDIAADDQSSSETKLSEIVGEDFIKNSVHFSKESESIKVYGFAGLPTLNASSGMYQYYFVNRRSIKDKILLTAVKIAYQNLIPHGRYPKIVLFLELDPYRVDVNVHPTKAEVRFRDSNEVRDLIVDAIRSALKAKLYAASSTVSSNYVVNQAKSYSYEAPKRIAHDIHNPNMFSNPMPVENRFVAEPVKQTFHAPANTNQMFDEPPLGHAKCQIGNTYIISETKEGLMIVDQHAAHERLVLEKMKEQLSAGNIRSQQLLIPEIIELSHSLVSKISEYTQDLERFGFVIEVGDRIIKIKQIPVIFGKLEIKEFIQDVAEYLLEHEGVDIIQEKKDFILGNIACHSSIRAGRKMNIEEMNALLREIERTPFSGQCNHGRPTHTKLSINDLEKIFERS
jgi:DNA mismatch repair protein MutL